ncbi:adenylate/guanylate cyclase domain-containing protein [Hyalangium sp.]|uniref:adenylate/guanylate cyclase domain-containing protein n=1 Tax=Hyalangium sp. TaxID=2028555 RepID=UPI002D3EEBDC|nr:adenylate/guanylate cyclase domain-containing protein [Hyalangium sp.]HYI00278.1 adenylate/guanylate cyclase domain-containing protein [Hyalangium sp.]
MSPSRAPPNSPDRAEDPLLAEKHALEKRVRELEAKARSLDAINRLAASLLQPQTDVDDILWDVAQGIVAHLGLEDCVIYLFDEQREYLVQRAAFGPKNPREREILAPIRIKAGMGIAGTVALTGMAELISDTRKDPRYIQDDQQRLSELAIPIFSQDTVIGVLDSEHSQEGFFTEEHLHILTTVTTMMAARVVRAQLDAQIRDANRLLEVRITERTRELSEATHRSDRLLRNILPHSIVERLKRGEHAIAERFDDVTVLFADLVDFTRWSTLLPPEHVVEVLGQVFTEFDALTEHYGLEKIKTIGDAYMVVAGLPAPRADHREVMALMALAIVDAIRRLNRVLGTSLDVRIGMHSGPVVAGIIGTHKFAYDLWGDTVNMASRLESHGVAGRIHVSEATWVALRDRFAFEPRGEIEVKSIGRVKTWLLKGVRE